MDGLVVLKAAWDWHGPILVTVVADAVNRRMKARRYRRMGCLN